MPAIAGARDQSRAKCNDVTVVDFLLGSSVRKGAESIELIFVDSCLMPRGYSHGVTV